MKKPVIVISSHVARGSVGNRAAVFALEVLGHRVWAVPTIILPFHPGHGPATRIVPGNDQLKLLLDDLLNSLWIGEIGAVLTGYMANGEQAQLIGNFIAAIRAKNRDMIYACDPVIGDHGKLYVAEETAEAVREFLVKDADIITPNLYEFSWLTGKNPETADQAAALGNQFPEKTVLITSVPGYMRGNVGNLLLAGSKAIFAEHRQLQNPPNGPGDLTSALFLSNSLEGNDPAKILQRTTASVFEIIASAAKRGADELMLESDAKSIVTPMAMVQMRQLAMAGRQVMN